MNAQSLIQRAIFVAFRVGRRSALPLMAALVAASVQAQTLITFEEVRSGTVIDNAYPGVTFSNPAGGNVHALSSWKPASPSNTVAITSNVYFDARDGAVDVTFSTPQQWASIDVAAYALLETLGTPTARPFIEAYDSGGNLIGRSYFQGALPSPNGATPYERMTVAMTTATIKRIRFSVQVGTPRVYGFFDNLKYSATPAPPFCSARAKASGGC